MPSNAVIEYGLTKEASKTDETTLQKAIADYNISVADDLKVDVKEACGFYEKQKDTVNISIDDVGVKKQVTHRQKNENKAFKYVRNTIVHIEKSKEKYFLNAESTTSVLTILIAFLLNNRLLNCYLQFFVDGEKTLHSAILNRFSWHKGFGILLDWYHLKKKCETELSLALKNKQIRNSTLENILKYLWIGRIDIASQLLREIDAQYVKSPHNIEVLIGYFERNRSYIPCYALRKKLGLRNSSNKGEKLNDLVVSERQKHNGMSWSKDGSANLATITAAHLNNELNKWFAKGIIDFKLVS